MLKLFLEQYCDSLIFSQLMKRVNLGDALQFWTKDLLKSTVHRVQIPPAQRYSMAYFVEPDPDVVSPTFIDTLII